MMYPMRVHFICRGNALRSIIAEAYLRSLELPNIDVISSGTVAKRYRTRNQPTLLTTTTMLNKHGIGKYVKVHSDQLTQDRLHDEDMTICMNQVVYAEGQEVVTFPKNTIVWNIVDAGEGERALAPTDNHLKYDEVIYSDIKYEVDQLVNANLVASK